MLKQLSLQGKSLESRCTKMLAEYVLLNTIYQRIKIRLDYLDHNLSLHIVSNSLTTDFKLKFTYVATFMTENIYIISHENSSS